MKKYLIVEEGYEYNDESYYRPESCGYTIESKLITSKEEAISLCEKMNSDYIKKNSDSYRDDNGEPIAPYKIISVVE